MKNNVSMGVTCMSMSIAGFCIGLNMVPDGNAFAMGVVIAFVGFFCGFAASIGKL